MATNPTTNTWRPLYFLNIYRLLISSLFVSFFYFKLELSPFASLDYQLFSVVTLAYFIFSLFSNFTIDARWPSISFQSHSHLFIDIIALLLLMHSSGGVSSGVGLLMIIPVAASSIFLFRLMSYFYAALASILILLDQFYLFLNYSTPLAYPQAGILGMILFATALTVNYLLDQVKDSEDLAVKRGVDLLGMENMASFVMQQLNTPVLLVNKQEEIQLKNDAASHICHVLKRENKQYLYELSDKLSITYQQWVKNKHINIESFVLENSHLEIHPHFTPIEHSQESQTLIFLEDISKLKHQAQQQKLAALGRLTASIAHEIRNPLAAISHAGELLAESTDIHQQDLRLTQIIEKQSKRLNKIIDTVLNLSKKQTVNKKEIDLSLWLSNYFHEQIHFSKDQVSIIYNDKNRSTYPLKFDPQHLQQILNNLLQNAIQHNLQGEKVILSIDYQTEIVIDVINRGKTIDDKDIPNLFEPFFTTRASGTGLGLYMAKELAQSNNAQLDFIPAKNETRFRLIIL